MRLSFFSTTTITYHHHHHHYSNNTLLSLNPIKPRWAHMDSTTINTHQRRFRRKDHRIITNTSNQKIVVIMGPTGCGKSKLSIDLATRFFSSEIINSDKMQVYRGLDITSNKIPMHDRLGVPHHLLGEFDSSESELTPSDFRSLAGSKISEISSRRKLPLIVGGSNSFIYSLLAKRFDRDTDVFDESEPDPVCTELRYKCCFLWVDVSLPVLDQYLSKRVDEMLESGMFDELANYFDSDDYNGSDSETRTGLRKAIGVPEFESYFKTFRYGVSRRLMGTNLEKDVVMMRSVALYEEAVRAIKDNTWQLAKRQMGKIQRLREAGWDLRRLDATEAIKAAMKSDSNRSSDIWERQVVEPSVKIVKRFLEE